MVTAVEHPEVDVSKTASLFRSMFYSDEYKDLKLKKCAPLHKCAECKSFNDEIGKCKDPVTMKDIRRRRDNHFADVKLERLEYHRKERAGTQARRRLPQHEYRRHGPSEDESPRR